MQSESLTLSCFFCLFLDVWLAYRSFLTGEMLQTNVPCIPLVEHGALVTQYFVQDTTRRPLWTAFFNMRMANFSSLERLVVNKSLSQTVIGSRVTQSVSGSSVFPLHKNPTLLFVN